MPELDVTDLTAMNIDRVDAVMGAANGAEWLIVKAAAESEVPTVTATTLVTGESGPELVLPVEKAKDCPTCGGSGKIMDGNRDCPDCGKGGLPAGKVAKEASTDPEQPGSGPWEAEDAANLRTAATMLAQVASRLQTAQDRERAEVAAGAVEDCDDVWDLDDALSALDCVLGIVARLSFGEAQEAAEGGHDDLAVTKALRPEATEALTKALTTITDLLGGDTTQEVEKMTADELKDLVSKAVADAFEGVEKGTETETPAPEGDEVAKAEEPAAPAAEVTEPDGLMKAADVEALLKSTIDEGIKAAVTPLEERLANVEKQARRGGPLLNGAAGVVGQRHGQTIDNDQDLRKALDGKTPAERAEILAGVDRERLGAAFGSQA